MAKRRSKVPASKPVKPAKAWHESLPKGASLAAAVTQKEASIQHVPREQAPDIIQNAMAELKERFVSARLIDEGNGLVTVVIRYNE